MKMVRQTSLLAYDGLRERQILETRQELVLSAIKKMCLAGHMDVSDMEITAFLFKNKLINRLDPNIVRPRRKELLDKELIVECPKRACKVTAHLVSTWKAAQRSLKTSSENLVAVNNALPLTSLSREADTLSASLGLNSGVQH